MKDSTFEIDQVTKLREIERARMKRGEPGLRSELQGLIMRLQSGGVGPQSNDPRQAQAKRLWDKGFGRELNIDSFDAYLATIHGIPENLTSADDRFPELVLVDARLGITKICKLIGVEFSGDDQSLEDADPKKSRTEKVYWIRCQDGAKNTGKSICSCREAFTKDETGLTALEGLALIAQFPESVGERGMELLDSWGCDIRCESAYLAPSDPSGLFWNTGYDEDIDCLGVASRRI